MSDEDGLVHAYVLDGAGGARRVEWPGVRGWRPGTGTLWVHVDRGGALVKQWLAEESGIEPLVVSALIAEETRPALGAEPVGLAGHPARRQPQPRRAAGGHGVAAHLDRRQSGGHCAATAAEGRARRAGQP